LMLGMILILGNLAIMLKFIDVFNESRSGQTVTDPLQHSLAIMLTLLIVACMEQPVMSMTFGQDWSATNATGNNLGGMNGDLILTMIGIVFVIAHLAIAMMFIADIQNSNVVRARRNEQEEYEA